jgi:hypothetical protein
MASQLAVGYRLRLVTLQRMGRKPTKPDDLEQSKLFIETAEEVGADDERALDRAFKRIGTSKNHPAKTKRIKSLHLRDMTHSIIDRTFPHHKKPQYR